MYISLLLAASLGAEPEKAIDLPEADRAALADKTSKAHIATLEKYDGKLLKLTGPVGYSGGGYVQGIRTEATYSMIVRGGTAKERPLSLQLLWADDKANAQTTKALQKQSPKSIVLTVYGRAKFSVIDSDGKRVFANQGLEGASTDLKVAAAAKKD